MSDKITEDLGKLFEKLESVARETKLEEKKKIDYVETTESDISSLFAELEKVSQETKKLNDIKKKLQTNLELEIVDDNNNNTIN